MADETTQLNKWEEELAAEASAVVATAPATGSGIQSLSVQGGRLKVGDKEIPGSKLSVIVLVDLPSNQYYPGVFNPKATLPPVCYAFGDPSDLSAPMVPHAAVPEKQCDNCQDCPHNQWPDGGGAKACKNKIRIAVLLASDAENPESVADAELKQLDISPTNLKYFNNYRAEVERLEHRPLWSVVSEIAVTPDNQVTIKWRLLGKLMDGAVIQALRARREAATVAITGPFPKPIEKAPVTVGKWGKQ